MRRLADFDDSAWRVLSPPETLRRLSTGRVCFNWYRIAVTIPERVGDFDPTGSTVVFEVVIDDYAEMWVNGELPLTLGDTGGPVVGGFNTPNRVVLTEDARPGQRFQIAVFGINGPISAAPHNYIWMRTATLDFYAPERAHGRAEPAEIEVDGRRCPARARSSRPTRAGTGGGRLRVHRGPGVDPDGALLFSSPNTNAIYRWTPDGARHGVPLQERLHRYRHRPLRPARLQRADVRPAGRLTICQHGNRRVIRVEPHGNLTVLADRSTAGG